MELHDPPMLVDKTSFGLVIYNHVNLYRLRKHLVIGQLNENQFFSAFHWPASDTPAAPQCITVQLPISKTLCIAATAGLFFINSWRPASK